MGATDAGIALARDAGGVEPAAQIGAAVNVVVTRAEKQYTETVAKRQTAEAEAARLDAERRAEEAEQRQEQDDDNRRVIRPAGPPPPNGNDVHGGVAGPGF